jgi:ABC-2 type transport system permease protein
MKMKEFKIWLKYTNNSFQQTLNNRFAVLILLVGKILRIVLFVTFLHFLFNGTRSLAGYNREQIIFFYLAFNLIDSLGQMLYREVYRFRPLVVSGGLDLVLTKPISPLLRVLMGGADVIDLIMLVFIFCATVWYGLAYISANPAHWLLFFALVINGLLISTAFHLLVLGLGILTVTVDHFVMIYRDLVALMRIPVDLYAEPLRTFLTFVIPLGIMITFPAKSLMGLLPVELIIYSLGFSCIVLFLSLKFWHFSLRFYQSASS